MGLFAWFTSKRDDRATRRLAAEGDVSGLIQKFLDVRQSPELRGPNARRDALKRAQERQGQISKTLTSLDPNWRQRPEARNGLKALYGEILDTNAPFVLRSPLIWDLVGGHWTTCPVTKAVLPRLVDALKSADTVVTRRVLDVLELVDSEVARRGLTWVLLEHTDPGLRVAVVESFDRYGTHRRKAVESLLLGMADADPLVRKTCRNMLRRLSPPHWDGARCTAFESARLAALAKVAERFVDLVSSRRYAVDRSQPFDGDTSVHRVLDIIKESIAIRGTGPARQDAYFGKLARLLDHPEPEVVETMLELLGKWVGPDDAAWNTYLVGRIDDPSPTISSQVIREVSARKVPAAVGRLARRVASLKRGEDGLKAKTTADAIGEILSARGSAVSTADLESVTRLLPDTIEYEGSYSYWGETLTRGEHLFTDREQRTFSCKAIKEAARNELDLRAAEDAIRKSPGLGDAHFRLGNVLLRLRSPDRAITAYTETIRLDPRHAKALNNRGRAYLDQGQHAKALADFDAAIALDPHFAVAYHNRGQARLAAGDLDGATDDFARRLQLDPANPA